MMEQILNWHKSERLSDWWISFVDEDTRDFRGACIVRAHNHDNALRLAWYLGINPGGELLATRVGEKSQAKFDANFPPEFRWRLLTHDEVAHLTVPAGNQESELPFNDKEIAKKCGF